MAKVSGKNYAAKKEKMDKKASDKLLKDMKTPGVASALKKAAKDKKGPLKVKTKATGM